MAVYFQSTPATSLSPLLIRHQRGGVEMKQMSLYFLGIVAVLAGLGMTYLVMARPKNLVESFDPFELVTEQHTSHWRLFNPNGGMIERIDETTQFYRLRHRGKD